MDFRITDEQELLLESLGAWLDEHCPEAEIRKIYEQCGASDELHKAWVDDGFGMLGIPEEYGGTPIDTLTLVMFQKELARKVGGMFPPCQSMISICDMLMFGNEKQREMCLEEYRKTGRMLAALAISEPGAGSDNAGMSTIVYQKEGKMYLNGTKTFVTDGDKSGYHIVVAKDDVPDRDNKNFSMWLVPVSRKGITISSLQKIGHTYSSFCEVHYDDVEIFPEDLFGIRGKGFVQLMHNFEIDRMIAASASVGWAEAALEDAARYAPNRHTFGQPLSSHQLIMEKLTDMEIKVQNMQNMLYKCAWEYDNDISVRLNSALLKRYCSKTAVEVCAEAMQIFGGIGYTTEMRVSRLWKEAQGWMFGGGTPEIMVHIAGRQVVKKYN